MTLKLVQGAQHERQIIAMLNEWRHYNQTHSSANLSPRTIFTPMQADFDAYLKSLNCPARPQDGIVPATTYFGYDSERDLIVGAVNIRHYLNDHLLQVGGHIGAGVRPSERCKGYGSELLRLALIKCQELGLQKVLVTCEKNNFGSARVIMHNGGKLENEISVSGQTFQRYWIRLF